MKWLPQSRLSVWSTRPVNNQPNHHGSSLLTRSRLSWWGRCAALSCTSLPVPLGSKDSQDHCCALTMPRQSGVSYFTQWANKQRRGAGMTRAATPPITPQSCQSLEELRKSGERRGTGFRMVMSPLVIPRAWPVGDFPFGLIGPQLLRLLLCERWPGQGRATGTAW